MIFIHCLKSYYQSFRIVSFRNYLPYKYYITTTDT
nr:MAG TPA: hypothetical protein [Caudoviricetes sp.]